MQCNEPKYNFWIWLWFRNEKIAPCLLTDMDEMSFTIQHDITIMSIFDLQ